MNGGDAGWWVGGCRPNYPSVSSQATKALWLDEALALSLSSFPLLAGSSRVSDLGELSVAQRPVGFHRLG